MPLRARHFQCAGPIFSSLLSHVAQFVFAFHRFGCLTTSAWSNLRGSSTATVPNLVPPRRGLVVEGDIPSHSRGMSSWAYVVSFGQPALFACPDLYLLMDFAVSGLAVPCMMLIGSFLSKGRPWTSSVFPAAPEVRDATCVRGYGYGLEESEDVSEAIGHGKAAFMPSAWLHLTDMVEFFWERTGLTSSIPMEEQKRSGPSVNALQQHWLAPDSGFVPFRPHSCHFFFRFHT